MNAFINHKTTLILTLIIYFQIRKSKIFCSTYTVIYEADGDNLSPTRINMQLVYGEKNNNISIDSSMYHFIMMKFFFRKKI